MTKMEKKTPFQRLSKLQIVLFDPILNQIPQSQPFLLQHLSSLILQVTPIHTFQVLNMLPTYISIIAATALVVFGVHLPVKRDIVDLGITSFDSENDELSTKRDIIDYGIQTEDDNDSLSVKGDASFIGEGELPDGTKFKKFKRGDFDILDFGVRNITEDSPLSKRNKDWVQSCGPRSAWMPVDDVKSGNSPGSGFNTAVAAYCYHITHSLDNQPTVLGHGQAT